MARVAERAGRRDPARTRRSRRSSSRAGEAVGRPTPAGEHARRRRGDQRRLRPRHDAARARPPAPPLDRPEDRARRSSPARRSCCTSASRAGTTTSPHHTHPSGRGLPPEPRRHREAARPVRRPVVLRAERLRHRPVAGAAGHRARSTSWCRSRTSTPNVDWAERGAALPRAGAASSSPSSASTTSSGASASRRMVTPADWEQRVRDPPRGDVQPGAQPRADAAPAAAQPLRGPDGVYLVGGGTHPGSGLPVIYESARGSRRGCWREDLGVPSRRLDRRSPGPAAPNCAADADRSSR